MAGRALHSVRYLFRRASKGYAIPSHPKLALSMRERDKKQALELFEEIAQSSEGPSKEVLNNMLRFCQEVEDSHEAEKVISIVHEKHPDRDMQLSNVLIKCQSSFGWYSDAWQEYCRLVSQGETVREGTLMPLLTGMVAEEDTEKILELLKVLEKRAIPLGSELSESLLKMCVVKGDSWRSIFEAVMSLYKECEVLVEEEVADLAKECLKRSWGEVSAARATIIDGSCSVCDHKFESICISKEECDHLRYSFENILTTEMQSFGDGNKDMLELKAFKRLLAHSGQYDAVIDGLNVSFGGRGRHQKLMRNLTKTCRWVSKNLGRGLLILRAHFPKTARMWVEPGDDALQVIKEQLAQANIDTFVTRNRVKDDLYTMYGCLSSGPETYFVSNDQLGDIFNEIPIEERKLYSRWRKSRQVLIEHSGTKSWFKIPHGHRTRVQRTENGYHLPIKEDSKGNSWICLRRNI